MNKSTDRNTDISASSDDEHGDQVLLTSVGVPAIQPIAVMPGCLYLVGTPIGNLGDLSPRAAAILAAVDRIAAEDTRRTLRLLNALSISKPMISYHEHNQAKRGAELVARLQNGETLALVSDAGMPCISDPGEDLVRLCVEQDIPVVIVPGPTAAMTALAASGLPTGRFAFDGFLPTDNKERQAMLAVISMEPRTVILYEAPHRLRKTLTALVRQDLGDRQISIARELTKRYETILRTTVSEAVVYFETNEPRGEYVLILEGLASYRERNPELVGADALATLDAELDKLLRDLLAAGCSVKEAAREAAKQTGRKRNELYDLAMRLKKDLTDNQSEEQTDRN